ncbi:hypothetical protein GCM10023115_39190 [Pontixanthobacter gangjinensis]|uniref:Beta-lactamase-inhibitor-like PepSY-like domain-containing protein n=1 Tax=Christiangramia aestuarii TaxID=1028746 RepID=A0A7M4C1K5_9FLAO|nr:hypothetical protein [Christiangramia aestuarii]MUP40945.1 hypothetical protein [Christiangramia aestuarii]
MKKLVIGMFVLGLTSLGFSQDTNNVNEEVQLEAVEISGYNLNYLEKVEEPGISDDVRSLEREAAAFDVKSLDEFDGRKELYSVKFIATNGYLLADYDWNGKIVKTTERYRNINLPKNLVKSVLNEFPQSQFLKVVYNVNFDAERATEKTYRIRIMNNGKKKNLKISSDSNFNNVVVMY